MKFPEKFRQGDTIGLIAPSSPVKPEIVDRCIELMQNMGYRVKLGKSVKLSYHGYLAGPDDVRAEDVNTMFADKEVKAIFCIRGGNGSVRIMDKIDYDIIRRNPKVFVGYSDITNLNMAFYHLCDMVTFHGPMVSSNMLEHYDDYTRESFESTINMGKSLDFINPEKQEIKVVAEGHGEGTIIGGNLSLLINMLGTFYAPDFKDKILFIEDVHESVPNVDRMIMQLFQLHIFEQIKGLIIGDFSECENSYDSNFLIQEYIVDTFKDVKIPVMYNIICGHCQPTATIPLGVNCIMDTKDRLIRFTR